MGDRLQNFEGQYQKNYLEAIGHFTVVCLVTLPVSESEAGGDLALIQTFLPFIC